MTRLRKQAKGGAARKSSPSRLRRKFEVGDRVRIIKISKDLKNPNYDLKDAERREMRTAELFRFCLGRPFTVYGFDQYGNVELRVDKSREVRERFGKFHTIWCLPSEVELVSSVKN